MPTYGGRASVEKAITSLGARYGLDPGMGEQLSALLRMLAEDPLAPTTVTDPARAIDDHLADSLVALELPAVRDARTITDLGAGAGFPGLPLAIALPAIACRTGRELGAQMRVHPARIHGLRRPQRRSHQRPRRGLARRARALELVTARALAPLEVVVEYAAPLLQIGGRLLAWRGRRDPDAEAAGGRAAEALGMEVGPVRTVRPYPGAVHRHLHLMSKVMDTPTEFPRRPGMAVKRPLGGRSRSPSDRSRR